MSLYILLGVILLLALVLASRVKMDISYSREEEDDTVSLEFLLLGVINYKIEIPVLEFQQKLSGLSITTRTELETGGEESEEILGKHSKLTIENLEEMMEHIRRWGPFIQSLPPDLLFFLNHMEVQSFNWRTSIGTADAAATGLLSGLAWAIQSGLTSVFYRQVISKGAKPKLAVEPNFRKQGFSTEFRCIFEIRVGYIMVTGIKILKKLLNKQGVKKLGRTSHRRSYENSHGEYQGNG